MWDNGHVHTSVIEHGVTDAGTVYSGELERGIVVINNLSARGRLLGAVIVNEVRRHIPVDVVGMGTEEFGIGEVLHPRLPAFISRYRFFFNPIRWTSLGLSICEAMMAGLPIVGLATTELSSVIQDGKSGYIHTDINYLLGKMKLLLNNREHATELGKEAQRVARKRFSIQRFTMEWKKLFEQVINTNKLTASQEIVHA